MFRIAAHDVTSMPRILQAAKQVRKTTAAMRKADAEITRQPVKRAAQNHCHDAKLRLGGHCDSPGAHPALEPFAAHHVPGMHQHGSALMRTMRQKTHDTFVVHFARTDVVANLHADASCAHRPGQLGAGQVGVLQRAVPADHEQQEQSDAEPQPCRNLTENRSG